MNKQEPIHRNHDDTTADDEARLRLALEHETDFKRRQKLLKALWRLHQSGNSDAGSSSRDTREHDSLKSKQRRQGQVPQAVCC